MHSDDSDQHRQLLENDPPAFVDRVDTPWEQIPDLASYNGMAFKRISRDLNRLSTEQEAMRTSGASLPSSRGVLVLGEAGTGKTHLLMRLAQNLAKSNHILFVRRPNNEEAIAQHIWTNIVNSLTRTVGGGTRSQIDDLLGHVFSSVLIPEFESDIQKGIDVEQRQRWVNTLKQDPCNLFEMLGEGQKRSDNMRAIRRRTLRFLQINQPDVDQSIAHALITYCFVAREERRRILLTWLSGQDIDPEDAKSMGLPESWVTFNESSTDLSIQQQREEQALRAIQSLGILSTYYQPLILAFDQLEGLRDEERLTHRWGDIVKEIFTMAPNLLIVTCIFPSLWESWFGHVLDDAAKQRIAQRTLELEKFGQQHATALLETHLREHFTRYRLPTSIFPFTEDDIGHLCFEATSPRVFLQKARTWFETWLDEDDVSKNNFETTRVTVTQDSIDTAIQSALNHFESEQRKQYGSEIPNEQDFFGRIKNIFKDFLKESDTNVSYDKASCGKYVMPPNLIIKHQENKESLCVAVINSVGNAFAARIRNLRKVAKNRDQFNHLIVIRDRRSKQIGAKSQEYLDDVQENGGAYVQAEIDEITLLNAIYDTIVAIEEHDLSIGSHEIDKRQFVEYLRSNNVFRRMQLFRQAGRLSEIIGHATSGNGNERTEDDELSHFHGSHLSAPEELAPIPSLTDNSHPPRAKKEQSHKSSGFPVKVVVGDSNLASTHLGIVGRLRNDGRCLGLSLTKPQCAVVLGYMGSGKSYALGVLIENALLSTPTLVQQSRPMTAVAFNFRRNPEARFEYAGFGQPNTEANEVQKLISEYAIDPDKIGTVNVFGYEPELLRRAGDYEGLPTYPIQFRSDELGADHWEMLMKPPSAQSEYMAIVRDIIQKLFYEDRLTFKNLERHILTDERLSNAQRQRAKNRLSFAERWIDDDRTYTWSDVLQAGSLNIFDLRMQTMEASEALKLCLVITDLVRRTRNGVNKLVVFDEAHEYVDCKELVGELENSITQIRHDGLSFILASQFPERIPERIFKYLLTRFIFKLPTQKAINYVRKAAPNLESLSAQGVSNLDLEQGICFIQTDDDCSDSMLRVPQLLEVRPRCTQHGGATLRQKGSEEENSTNTEHHEELVDVEFEEEVELCPKCGETLILRQTKKGPAMVCGSYPACRYARRATEN